MPSTKSLLLYTSGTPNGRRVTIYLEELKAAYGLDYEVHPLEISKGMTKEAWFVKLNPHAKIPVLVDRKRDDFVIYESSAILQYLQHHYDKENKFGFEEGSDEYFQQVQWLCCAHAGLAPSAQQYVQLKRSGENAPVAIERAVTQLKSFLSVLNAHLADRQFIAGKDAGKYTTADMNAAAFVRSHAFFDIPTLDEWPNLKAWLGRVSERPAVKTGVAIPY